MGRPVRTCVGCRERAPKSDLTRLVANQQTVTVDRRQTAPGRGAYLHPGPDCLALAIRRRSFPRALRVGAVDTEPLRRGWSEDVRGDDGLA